MKKPLNWLIVSIPLGIAIVIAVWLDVVYEAFPVLQLRIDLASLVLLVGVILSAGVVGFLYLRKYYRNQREETAAVAAKEQRLFLQRLDHELKNPLSTIKAGMTLLASDIDSGILDNSSDGRDLAGSTIEKINVQVQRLVRLLTDLRKLSDIEFRSLELTRIDLDGLLRQLVDEMELNPACDGRKITLSVPTAPWQLPDIYADEDLIYLSLYNLFDNAVKFSRCDSTIEVRAYENHHDVLIEIADNGIGIPVDDFDKIWGELYRSENARGISGSGLGLPIVRAIIKRHQGEITVRSRDGVGTVFTVRLPKKL